MAHYNLKHLRYFWYVAHHGSITKASKLLHLTPQTISGQLRELEQQVNSKLFQKSGRNLVLTETGRLVYSYADEMFRLSTELQDVLEGRLSGTTLTLNVGVAMVVPKLLAYRILEPVLSLPENVRLVCQEAPLESLIADLSIHKLDLVLADSPMAPNMNVKAYNHILGESGISFFAANAQAKRYSKNFPASMDRAPILLPMQNSVLRHALEQWFEKEDIKPVVVAEFEDRALMKAFGEAGVGIFTSPTTVENDVIDKYGVKVIGRTDAIKERFYAISTERRIKHPAVASITESARNELF